MYRLADAIAKGTPDAPNKTLVMVADLLMNLSFTIVPVSIAMRKKVIMLELKKMFREIFSHCSCGKE